MNKVISFLKRSYKYIIFYLILIILCFIKLPYYINIPGGLINLEDRINISDSYSSTGTYNLTYVTEFRANLPLFIYSYFNPNWDIIKEDDVTDASETYEDLIKGDTILKDVAYNNAIIVAYTKAKKDITIVSKKLYVIHVVPEAKTDLRVGDQILECNGLSVTDNNTLSLCLEGSKENELINLKVINNNHEYNRYANIIEYDNRLIIGITATTLNDIVTSPVIESNKDDSESGPSGGFMTSLAVYDYLIEEDLTHGLRISGTGTIDEEGIVGAIGGVKYKLAGAVKKKADIFFVPSGDNYEEAIKLKEKNNYDITIVSVSTIDDAINYLRDYQDK